MGEPHREGLGPREMPGPTPAASRIAGQPRKHRQADQRRPATALCFPLPPHSRPESQLSRRSDTEQISRGKLSRLLCTAAGSTLRPLDGYGLRGKLPARPTLAPCTRFLSIDSHI
jgi:hypothetical protein